jgi:cytoskeletal protein CcmA (bactofilin family)
MANIRKSFNFRSGLQVDNDNFVVNSNGLVGIGTSAPSQYLLNVYGDTRVTGLTTTQDLFASRNLEVSGVTTVGFITASRIEVSGDANVSGVLTASQIRVGNSDVVDNLIGYARTTFITDNGGIGLHTTSKIGINTSTSPGASDPALSVFGDVNVTGIATANEFSGSLSGDVNSTGISTFTSLEVGASITASSGIVTATTFSGNLSGTATTATNLADGANITTGTISNDRLPSAITSNINILSGISYFNQIGVNTITPQSDIHVRKGIQAEIQVTSDSNASLIGLGRSNSITGYNGVLRYGNTDGAFAYSDAYSLDIMNYGTGNINYYLNPSEIAGTTGGFFWHKEANRLMALTSAGNLGLGITNPTRKIEVSGTAYVSGDVEFDNNLDVNNNLIIGVNGRIGINSSSPAEKLDVAGNIAATGTIVAGDVTGTSFTKVGGSSTEFLKADGSIDTTVYLTSGDALVNVVEDTTPQLGGDLDLNNNNITGDGNIEFSGDISCADIICGVTTAIDGFTSENPGNPVQISVVGTTLTFNVVGVGSTSLTLS